MTFGNPDIPTMLSPLRRLNARAGPTTLNLGLGQPEVDMPEPLRELALQALGRHKLGYTPNAGRLDLREEIGRFYGLDPRGILVSHGAQEGLMAVLFALLKNGDEVLLPDPGFLAYPTMVKMAGGSARFFSLKSGPGRFAYDVERILAALTRKTRAVLLCSPNNPTGTMFPDADRERLLRELERRKIFLLCDDVYSELAFSGEYAPASRRSDYAVTVSSWSKSLALTGWRIGFVHCRHRELQPKILAAHQYLATCASAPAQALVLEALRAPALYREVVAGFRDRYAARLRRLLSFFPETRRPGMPEGGFYLFLPLGRRSDRRVAEELLRRRNLLVVPGSYFGRRGAGCLRVSVAAGEESIRLAGEILACELSIAPSPAK